MVRNRSSLVYFFLNKVLWAPILIKKKNSKTPVVLKNHRKKLTLKLFCVGPNPTKNLLGAVVTSRTRCRTSVKKNLLFLDTNTLPFFTSFGPTNQYFTSTNTVGLFFLKQCFLTVWLFNQKNTSKLIFTNSCLLNNLDNNKTTNLLVTSGFYDIWATLRSFKYLRTLNQPCSFLFQPTCLQKSNYFRFFFNNKEIMHVWYGTFRRLPKVRLLKQISLKVKPLSSLKTNTITYQNSKKKKLTYRQTTNYTFILLKLLQTILQALVIKLLTTYYQLAILGALLNL